MSPKSLTLIFLLCSFSAMAQYKNDNVAFKTVDPEELCEALKKNKGYLLLDVRSKGEYEDTSTFASLNIGHLKGAQNINIRELDKRLGEIQGPKDRPIFVYCSHSQRSRRASKLLADSGYTNIYNINAGMTSFYYTKEGKKECFRSLLETKNSYKMIGTADLCEKMNNKDLFILDVRSDSAFRHISTDAKVNAIGVFRNSVNIPLADLQSKLSAIPTGKEIVVTDLFGGDASKAGVILQNNGYKNVSVLIEGVDRMFSLDPAEFSCRDKYQSPVKYNIIGTTEFARYSQTNKDYVLLDIRTTEAFTNKHKDVFRNIGHLDGAIHIPAAEVSNRIAELNSYKNKQIIVYGFSGDVESYATANTLSALGYKVSVLSGGLFNVRWLAANHRDKSYLKKMVVDVPEINL